jgi:hypothetical protein
MQEIQNEVKKQVAQELDFLYREMEKIRTRMNDLEQVISIYNGGLKVVKKNKQ